MYVNDNEKLGGILCYAGWKLAHMLYFVLFIISEKIYFFSARNERKEIHLIRE